MKSRRDLPPRDRLSVENLYRIGIPKEYHHLRFIDLEGIDTVVQKMEKYVKRIHDNYENNVGLFLLGSNGVGKSAIVSILLREAYRHRYTAKRTTMNMITPIGVKAKWDDEVNSEYHQYYLNVDFLAIEEVGKEQEGDKKANINILEEILRHRNERGYPTFIVTNLPPSEFKERYGNSIWSLINETMVPIKIVGEDKRITKKSKELMAKFEE